jgi:hypothetical protein
MFNIKHYFYLTPNYNTQNDALSCLSLASLQDTEWPEMSHGCHEEDKN